MTSADLKGKILRELRKRKENGMSQTEIEQLLGFSRSHVSETLNLLGKEDKIVRRSQGKLIKRIWLKNYFPGYVAGILRVGFLKSSEYTLFLESVLQVAKERAYTVELRPYNDVIELVRDLQGNVLEIALSPTFTLILFRLLSENFVIEFPIASGGSSIFLNKSSSSSSCASSESSSMMLFTREYFQEIGLPEIVTFKNPVKAIKGFEDGEYRYITAWEPYRTLLSSKEEYDEISTYAQTLDDLPCCSVAVNSHFNAKEKDFVKMIHERYKSIIKYADSIQPDSESVKELSKATGIERGIIRESLCSYHFMHSFTIDMVKKYLAKVGIIIADDKLEKFFSLREF